jgi:hypothetical protein
MSKELRILVEPSPKDLLAPDIPKSPTFAVTANFALRWIWLVNVDGVVNDAGVWGVTLKFGRRRITFRIHLVPKQCAFIGHFGAPELLSIRTGTGTKAGSIVEC